LRICTRAQKHRKHRLKNFLFHRISFVPVERVCARNLPASIPSFASFRCGKLFCFTAHTSP
jgi:hypothetical protein